MKQKQFIEIDNDDDSSKHKVSFVFWLQIHHIKSALIIHVHVTDYIYTYTTTSANYKIDFISLV